MLKDKNYLFQIFLTLILSLSISVNSADKPNIVLILIDDLGLTDLQLFGGEINTPNIDAIGMRACCLQIITQHQSVLHQGQCY